MTSRQITVHCLAFALLLGCASTNVTGGNTYQHERVARPDRILVYDFAATHADLPDWSAPAQRYGGTMTATSGESLEKNRELGFRSLDSGAGKSPGLAVPLAVGIATHNPIGLVAGTALHAAGEVSGKTTIDGSAQRTAKKIGEELKVIFENEGWI